MRITGLYAALATLLVLILTVRVVVYRYTNKIGIGDNGDAELRKRIRAHGNACEYLPLALLLLLLLELNQTAPVWLHLLGIVLLAARCAHAWGLSHKSGTSPGRLLGMALTIGVLAMMAVMLLWQGVAMRVIG